MWITALMYVFTGLLFMGIAIPLIQKKIRPNPFYGFRTKKTLEDPQIWYAANTRAGVLLFLAGGAIVAGTLLLAPLAILLKIGVGGYTLGCLALMVTATSYALVASYLYIKKL